MTANAKLYQNLSVSVSYGGLFFQYDKVSRVKGQFNLEKYIA